MDIEERAEKWAREYADENEWEEIEGFGRQDLIKAYLAGSAQTQADYCTHFYGEGPI